MNFHTIEYFLRSISKEIFCSLNISVFIRILVLERHFQSFCIYQPYCFIDIFTLILLRIGFFIPRRQISVSKKYSGC